ncbi:MAG: GNAT family N-acetyltransferase [Anaerolineae bacterium]|nr:GNAT family N-acetyltransferase [Anaerolineae bacterium]
MEMKYRNSTFAIDRSPEDEARFGFSVARCRLTSLDDAAQVHEYCRTNAIQLLIARCSTSRLEVAQQLETHGYQLMDTLLYYAFDLVKKAVPNEADKVTFRFATPGDAGFIEDVARASFVGYFGHYHADQRLNREQADEGYVSWAVNSVAGCTPPDGANPVLVAETDRVIAGFATMRENSADEGEGVLFGVSPAWQGYGIYRSFMLHFMGWCQRRGMARAVVSTQITNLAVQKVWVRLGFEPSESYYTFHKWFD